MLTFYDKEDRDFATRALKEDSELLRAFAQADVNIACRDPGTSTNHLRGQVRYNHNMTGGKLALTLVVSTLKELLTFTRREAVFSGPRYYANVTAKRDQKGDMIMYSHFHPDIGKLTWKDQTN